MLAPIVKGVSLFQVALLACIGFSINGANTVYQTGVNVFVEQGGMLVSSPPPQLQENATELSASILRSQVVQAYFQHWEDKSLPNSNVHNITFNEDSREWVLQFNAPENTGIENELMGTVILDCPPGGIYDQRIEAIMQLINDTMPIADAIVDPDQLPNRDDLVRAVDAYGSRVMEAMTSHSESMGDLTEDLEQFKAQATSSGWATAGAYYFSIAKINDRRRNAIAASAKSINPNIAVVSSHATEDFERIAAACDTYIRNSLLRNEPSTISETAQVAEDSQIMGLLRRMFSWLFAEKIFSGIATRMTENDPVSTVIDYGHTLISGTSAGFQTYLAAAGAVGTAKGWSDSLVGQVLGVATGGTKSAFVGATENVFNSASPMIIVLLISLFIFAFTLAYYLPALPMVLWISCLAGWIILVLESLVAAPLWVAAHALPEGEGLAGQHGRQGYILFLNVLLRPALMVTGLLFSMVIMAAIGKLIGVSMTVLGINLAGRYIFGLTSTIAMSVILCSLILIVAHKIYALIAHFPSTIIRWVGQHFHNLGEDRDETRTRRGFDNVGGRSEKAVEKGLGAGLGDKYKGDTKRRSSGVNEKDFSTFN
jgi:hypothetical protein